MAHDPELLILDEPTSGLDAFVRREFMESMVDRAASGKTVLVSSHQIVEVERVADIVAIIRKGKLLTLERLDTLKGRIREITVTLGEEADDAVPPALAQLNGRLLSRRHRGRQWQALVENMPEGLDTSLRGHAGVQSVDVRAPSLEEIFVAYMEGPEREAGKPDAEEVIP